MSGSSQPLKSPASSGSIRPDPSADGSTIRKAFLAESIFNLFTIPLITHTRLVLSYLVARETDINPTSILFARLFGGLVVGALTPALWYGARNTRQGIESRPAIYTTLGMGEVCIIPILLLEAGKNGTKDAALSPAGAIGSVMLLAPPLMWRIYVLFIRPDLLGRYTEIKQA